MGTFERPVPLHRGDRVVDLVTKQRALVDGWKDGRVLICFGVQNAQPVREWRDRSALDDVPPVVALEDAAP